MDGEPVREVEEGREGVAQDAARRQDPGRGRPRSDVIRNPESTKKESTPEKPPGTEFGPEWKAMIARTDSARMPSSPRMWPSVGWAPRALASVLMVRQVSPADVAAPPSHIAETSVGARPHCLPQDRAPR